MVRFYDDFEPPLSEIGFYPACKQETEAGDTKKLETEGYVDAENPGGLRKITSHESDFATRQFKKVFFPKLLNILYPYCCFCYWEN